MSDAANGVEAAKQNAEAVKREAQAAADNAADQAKEGLENAEEKAMSDINRSVDAVKEPARQATPVPEKFDTVSSASDLKSRLDWGEPALTIIDVRDREAFNDERIMGAISMPMEELVDRAPETLEKNRDIYIYGDSDELTSQAAMQLSDAGFDKISALRGGLPAWKAIGGTTEGRVR